MRHRIAYRYVSAVPFVQTFYRQRSSTKSFHTLVNGCMKMLLFVLCTFLLLGCSPVTGLYVVNFADGWRNFEQDGVHIEVIPEKPRLGYLKLKPNHLAVFTAEQDSRIVPTGKARWKLDRDTLSIKFKSKSAVIDGKRFPKSYEVKRYWFTYMYTDSSKNSRALIPLDGGKTYHAYPRNYRHWYRLRFYSFSPSRFKFLYVVF